MYEKIINIEVNYNSFKVLRFEEMYIILDIYF